jgi:hypothetical protein
MTCLPQAGVNYFFLKFCMLEAEGNREVNPRKAKDL